MAGPIPTTTTILATPTSSPSTHLAPTHFTQQELTEYRALRDIVVNQLHTNLRLCHDILSMSTFPVKYAADMTLYRDRLWARLKVCQMIEFGNDPGNAICGIMVALEEINATPMPKLPHLAGMQQAVKCDRSICKGEELREGDDAVRMAKAQRAERMMIFDHCSWTWVDADGGETQKTGTFRSDDMETV